MDEKIVVLTLTYLMSSQVTNEFTLYKKIYLQRGEKRIMRIASLFLDQQGVVSSFENKRQNVHLYTH